MIKITILVISRAFARRLRAKQPDLRERLEEIVREVVPGSDPESDANRRIIIARALTAVRQDDDNLVVRIAHELCSCASGDEACMEACPVGALVRGRDGKCTIDALTCLGCEECEAICHSGAVVKSSDCLTLMELILDKGQNALHAIVAPSFVGQFGAVRDSQVKEAIRRLGFSEVHEVALGADILTVREADEFIDRMERGEDFMITSCCCPAFVKLTERFAPRINRLVSDSVSPMIAVGRLLKAADPDAHVVFIGPCLAKKAESRAAGLGDAVDLVLTFKEVVSLLEESGIVVEQLAGKEPMGDASHDGRIYAHTGGVSEAIARAVHDKRPDLSVRSVKGNGLKQCKELLEATESGSVEANFMEGMACPGGCLGGPGTVVKVAEAAPELVEHADQAPWERARESVPACELIKRWGDKIKLHRKA